MAKRLIDIACSNSDCSYRSYDEWLTAGEYPVCPGCGSQTERLWNSTAAAHGDDIPGGLTIEHGVCHDDGRPRTFYTKSEIRKAAKAKGLVWGDPYTSPPGRHWV